MPISGDAHRGFRLLLGAVAVVLAFAEPFAAAIELAPIADLTVLEDTALVPVEVGLTTEVSPGSTLIFTASPLSNGALFAQPPRVAGLGATRTLYLVPRPDASGSSRIEVRVADTSGNRDTRDFLFTVSPQNDPPTVELLNGSQFSAPAGERVSFSLRVADVDDPVGGLTVTLTADEPGLIEESSVTGSTAGRTVALRAAYALGATRVGIRVSDPAGAYSERFIDFSVTLPPAVDFGDAPRFYPVRLGDLGAWHVVHSTIRLGPRIDAEADGLPSPVAAGDDSNNFDDEDGVVWPHPIVGGATNVVQVGATAAGFIDAWIDFNLDGRWDDPQERVFDAAPVQAGANQLRFIAPEASASGTNFARVRYSTVGHLPPTGGAGVGEVEDAAVVLQPAGTLLDFGDAPAPYPTTLTLDGARHGPSPLMLGNYRDLELDAPGSGADDDGFDDEDGVGFANPLVPGGTGAVNVVASAPGRLDGWIDFNRDNDWSDPGEQVFTNLALAKGIHALTFAVPASAVPGETHARMRLSSVGGLAPVGFAPDGEVEDHRVTVAAPAPPCSLPELGANRRPNVIVIVSDDLGYADLGVQGCPDIPTPHIDSIARHGIRFTSGYVTAPVCSPSRAALMTGRYQQRFGHETNPGTTLETSSAFGLPLTESTLADRFRELDYRTGWVGKSHLGGTAPFHPMERGFQEFFGFIQSHHTYLDPWLPTNQIDPILRGTSVVQETNYLTQAFERECVDFITRHAAEPFFLYAPFNAVHFPLQSTADLSNRVMQLPIASPQRRAMAAVLLGLDDAVGAILRRLGELGLETNTLVVFTTDNGGMPGLGSLNTPLRGGKTEVYEGGIRVPLFLQWKGHFASNQVYHPPVSTLDILPTVIAAAGGTNAPAWHLDGVNLLPYLCGTTGGVPHPRLYWRIETDGKDQAEEVHDGLRAIREGDWKLVKPGVHATWELYHLATDIGETNDLALARPEMVRHLALQWHAWSDTLARPRWAVDDLQFETPEFILEDVRMGAAGEAYQAPDLLPRGRHLAFQDSTNALWRGSIDPATGFFESENGRDQLLDTGLAPFQLTQSGPRWGNSTSGPALFYSKPGPAGRLQLWRAGTNNGALTTQAMTADPSANRFAVVPSRDAADSVVRLAFGSGPLPSPTPVWSDETRLPQETLLPSHPGGRNNGCWIPGTADLVYAAEPSLQLARYRTATAQLEFVTDDDGAKSEPCAILAPEFNGELCYAAIVDQRSLALYRNLADNANGFFTRIATFALPTNAPQRFLRDLRPVDDSRGFNGVSYFTVAASEQPDPAAPGETAIWLVGLGTDPARPIARRLDRGGAEGLPGTRQDPWALAGADEMFAYYTQPVPGLPTHLHLARTGVRRPDYRGIPSGFRRLGYSDGFRAAMTNDAGIYVGGTETMHLVAHGGRLYASQGSLGNPEIPGDLINLPAHWSGAQVLVKDAPTAPWRLDDAMPPIFRQHLRVETLAEIAFTTDRHGTVFAEPARVLLAGLSDIGAVGSTTASARARIDGVPGSWEESHVAFTLEAANTISFGSHVDLFGRVQHVFAGLSNGEIYRGGYDTNRPGLIDWDSHTPEPTGGGPVTAFAECNGILYAACGLRTTNGPGSVGGGLFFRHDASRTWQLAYRWPHPMGLDTAPAEHRLMRGLTAVPEPHGGGRQVLIAARAWPGVIERIDPDPDPAAGHAIYVELDVRDFLARQWQDDRVRSGEVTLAYTGFTPATDPLTGEGVLLAGLWVRPAAGEPPLDSRSHFLIRHADATYEVASVTNSLVEWPLGGGLGAVRTLAPSPFAEDAPGTLYIGGFDAAGMSVRETAWIQRGDWAVQPELRLAPSGPGEWQLDWPNLGPEWTIEAGPALGAGAAWTAVRERSSRDSEYQSLRVFSSDQSTFFRLRRRGGR